MEKRPLDQKNDSEQQTKQSRWGFRRKTVWDWLQLLIVPLMLALVTLVFTAQQDARQQRIEGARAEAEQALAQHRAQDEALQAYLDQMGDLVLEKNLLEAETSDPVYTLAQARTSTIINRLDAERNSNVIRFLTDSRLTGASTSSVSVLSSIQLPDADLSGAFLEGADLKNAELVKADLSGAYLVGADLSGANLSGTAYTQAHLGQNDSMGADLSNAVLLYADLSQANLRNANLAGAILFKTDLTNANLEGANLSDAQGTSNEEIASQVSSLKGATMINGKKYGD